ncbi:glycosyltransferase [Microbulbifer aggregans]|uniref:glycosyltransferase n=1 Tax=Microbulbifer aggregans TaxID=1769779 RepID=UPI001CFC98EE|nr:glycosyltransferase [Microbulbifer aggregans]
MKVLFVTNTSRTSRPYFDPSVRYRCFNFAFSLERIYGWKTCVISQHELKNEFLDNFDAFVFHRPSFSEKLIEFVTKAKEKKKYLSADYDDLIFDVSSALKSSIYKNGRAGAREVCEIFDRNASALTLFEKATVSTEPLAEKMKEAFPEVDVRVVHNGLSSDYIDFARIICAKKGVKKYTVGYFSGTKSHDKDFKMVEEALLKLLSSNREFSLLLMGPLEVSDRLMNTGQVIHLPLQSYYKMASYVSQCSAIIAPLEDSVFNSCKSGLKFFESAIFNTKVFASPIPDIARFDSDLLSKCTLPEDWEKSLLDFAASVAIDNRTILREDVLQSANLDSECSKLRAMMISSRRHPSINLGVRNVASISKFRRLGQRLGF